MFDIQSYLEMLGGWFLTSGLQIFLILILMLMALKASRVVSTKLFTTFKKQRDDTEFKKRADTLSSVVRYVLNVGIFVIAFMMILKEVGIDIGPILAAAGVVGLAVGFGAQNLVQDLLSGFFILLEDQIRVGDVVQIVGVAGLVEKVNLRMVILRDLEGKVHYVRNGKIDIVSNLTKDFSCYVFDIGVAYREDVDEVIKIIKSVDEEMRNDEAFKNDILDPLEVFGLDQFGDSAVVIKARYKTKTLKQWAIGREFNRRLKIRFDEKDIEIPFPHRTLYMGVDKKGASPSLRVAVGENGEKDPAGSES